MNREHYFAKRMHHQFQTLIDPADENEKVAADTLSSSHGASKNKQASVANISKRGVGSKPDTKSGTH